MEAVTVAAALEKYAEEYRKNVDAPHFMRSRKIVVDYFLALLKPRSRVLDINCGTGVDIVEIARHGHEVCGFDISSSMIAYSLQEISKAGLSRLVRAEVCDFRRLKLEPERFHAALSNFGGINFTDDLGPVFAGVNRGVVKGGYFIISSVSRFSLSEFLIFGLKGKLKSAFRRLAGGTARIGGEHVRLFYHRRVAFASAGQNNGFELIDSFGINIFSPPQWAEDFYRRHLKIAKMLEAVDGRIRHVPPFRGIGDFSVFVFRKIGKEKSGR